MIASSSGPAGHQIGIAADTLSERLRAVVGDGVDLILDLVWGPVIAHAIDVARLRAWVVQVGNAAFEQLAAYAQSGALRLDVERAPLDDAASTWTRLEAGTATRKLVIVP